MGLCWLWPPPAFRLTDTPRRRPGGFDGLQQIKTLAPPRSPSFADMGGSRPYLQNTQKGFGVGGLLLLFRPPPSVFCLSSVVVVARLRSVVWGSALWGHSSAKSKGQKMMLGRLPLLPRSTTTTARQNHAVRGSVGGRCGCQSKTLNLCIARLGQSIDRSIRGGGGDSKKAKPKRLACRLLAPARRNRPRQPPFLTPTTA